MNLNDQTGKMRRITLLLMVVGLTWAMTGPAGAKIPISKDTRFARNIYKKLHKFNRQTTVEEYRKVGSKDPRWNDKAIALLGTWAWKWAYAPFPMPAPGKPPLNPVQRRKTAKELWKICDDPLVRYVALRDVHKTEIGEIKARLKIRKQMLASDYSTYRKLFAAHHVVSLWEKKDGKNKELKDAARIYLKQLRKLIHTPNLSKETKFFMGRDIARTIDGLPNKQCGAFFNSIDPDKTTMPWAVDYWAGVHQVEAAWDARGGKWANQVKPQGWVGFKKHLAKARRRLESAYKRRPDVPDAATTMISVAMGQNAGISAERKWFNRAVRAQFDYMKAYSKYAWAIRPRWGGSLDQLESFGAECLNTGRFDTMVPHMFHDAMDAIKDDDGSYQRWGESQNIKRFTRLFEGYAKADSRKESPAYFRSYLVAAAWKGGRYKKARKVLENLGDDFVEWPTIRYGGESRLTRSEIYARTEPVWANVAKAQDLIKQSNFTKAMKKLDTAIEQLPENDPARLYPRSVRRQAQFLKHAATGKWFDARPEPDMLAWEVVGGDWTIKDNGRLIGTANGFGWVEGLLLKTRTNFGRHGAIRGKVEVLESEHFPNAAVFFDIVNYPDHGHQTNVSFRPDQDTVRIASDYNTHLLTADRKMGKTVKFEIGRWHEKLRINVDGKVLFSSLKMPAHRTNSPRNGHVGIGAISFHKGSVKVAFDDLQLRKFQHKPDWAK